MHVSLDSLLVALFVALSPAEHEGQPGFEQGYEWLSSRPELSGTVEASDCRYFLDPVARGKCLIRTTRPPSRAGETAALLFPDETIWIAPVDPGMPFKYGANPGR